MGPVILRFITEQLISGRGRGRVLTLLIVRHTARGMDPDTATDTGSATVPAPTITNSFEVADIVTKGDPSVLQAPCSNLRPLCGWISSPGLEL